MHCGTGKEDVEGEKGWMCKNGTLKKASGIVKFETKRNNAKTKFDKKKRQRNEIYLIFQTFSKFESFWKRTTNRDEKK